MLKIFASILTFQMIFFVGICTAQIGRKNYQIKIEFQDYNKYYKYHDFYGDIVRYNQRNNRRSTIYTVNPGSFPENGKTIDISLGQNEDLELVFKLINRGDNKEIQSFHRSLTAEDIIENNTILFTISPEEWKDNSISTKDFIEFIKNIVVTREQSSIVNTERYSKLSNLPLGCYVFIDTKSQTAQKFLLPEFDTIKIDKTIPQSSLIIKFNKIVKKESGSEIDGKFHATTGLLACAQSIIQNSDFVELSMSLDKYYKKYIKNVGAIHQKYLSENEANLDPWFKDKISLINNESDKTRYQLHFTTGYKLIENFSITYNSYKNFYNENDINLALYTVVSAGMGSKFTKYRSVRDTTVSKDYLIDIETEDLSTTFENLAEYYRQKRTSRDRDQLIKTQITNAKSSLTNSISQFKTLYNQFYTQYSKSIPAIREDFITLSCGDDCLEQIIGIANDLKIFNADILAIQYSTHLDSTYNYSTEIKNASIANSTAILNNRFDLLKVLSIEVIANQGTIDLFTSQLSGNTPINFTNYLGKYVKSDLRSAQIPEFVLKMIN